MVHLPSLSRLTSKALHHVFNQVVSVTYRSLLGYDVQAILSNGFFQLAGLDEVGNRRTVIKASR